jgi:hypothetical protein
MNTRNSLRAIALATSCLVPVIAAAQSVAPATPIAPAAEPPIEFSGFAGFGLMGVFGHNPNQAGRYTGLNTSGLDVVIPEFDLLGRQAWNSGGVRYYELFGDNLVFQTGNNLASGVDLGNWQGENHNALANAGSLGFRAGDQGTWGVGIDYEAITYTGNVIDSIYTVDGATGSLNPGLTRSVVRLRDGAAHSSPPPPGRRPHPRRPRLRR